MLGAQRLGAIRLPLKLRVDELHFRAEVAQLAVDRRELLFVFLLAIDGKPCGDLAYCHRSPLLSFESAPALLKLLQVHDLPRRKQQALADAQAQELRQELEPERARHGDSVFF